MHYSKVVVNQLKMTLNQKDGISRIWCVREPTEEMGSWNDILIEELIELQESLFLAWWPNSRWKTNRTFAAAHSPWQCACSISPLNSCDYSLPASLLPRFGSLRFFLFLELKSVVKDTIDDKNKFNKSIAGHFKRNSSESGSGNTILRKVCE